MSVIFYNSAGTSIKTEVKAGLSSRLHQSLNGECTLDLTMPGNLLPGITLGDQVQWETLRFTVSRINRASQTAGALFSVSCEHISYLLNDITMPEGTYNGTVSAVLALILQGTILNVGSVDVSGSYSITVKSGANRREVLQQWATITGAEISYTMYQVNFRTHVGSSTAVELSEKENVKGLTIQQDRNSNAVNYGVELSRLQTLKLGDIVHIEYSTLEVDVTTRVITLEYDVFHPWNISMQCGDYVPTYYEAVQESISDMEEVIEEEIPEQVQEAVSQVFLKVAELDFSGWDSGYFTETLEDETVNGFMVDFDENGKPIKVTDGEGFETDVVWS